MNRPEPQPVLLYNLFPRLAGPFAHWGEHMARAADLGFNWLLLNPVFRPGRSGSSYAIADFDRINPELVDTRDPRPPWDQLRMAIDEAHRLGLRVMVDLVVAHTASDSPLVREQPSWFRWNERGELVKPEVWEGDRLVHVYEDLGEVANAESPDRDRLWMFWKWVVTRLLDAGFDGFRGHMAYQVPVPLWQELIAHARRQRPELLLTADTLGCPDWQVVEVARLGFDLCFNSSRWWDFQAPWCLDQYRATAPHVGTISFPESHDTPRLMEELHEDLDAVRQRYLFSALFSAGVMMPIGFELGFRRPLDVSRTRPEDWELGCADLCDFVRETNALKRAYPVFHADTRIERLNQPSLSVVALRKECFDGSQQGLIVLNTDPRREARIFLLNLPKVLDCERVLEVTPGTEPAEATRVEGRLPPSGFRVFVSA